MYDVCFQKKNGNSPITNTVCTLVERGKPENVKQRCMTTLAKDDNDGRPRRQRQSSIAILKRTSGSSVVTKNIDDINKSGHVYLAASLPAKVLSPDVTDEKWSPSSVF